MPARVGAEGERANFKIITMKDQEVALWGNRHPDSQPLLQPQGSGSQVPSVRPQELRSLCWAPVSTAH